MPKPYSAGMRALFLADAHLRRPSDDNYQALLAFLASERGRIDLLVLLGDIFEFWAGDRRVVHDCYQPLLDALAELKHAGTRLVWVEGNHDFDLGRRLTEDLGCQVFVEGGRITLDGLNVFLAHGDLADTSDTGYRLLRRLLRGRLLRTLIRHVPIQIVLGVALPSSRGSRGLGNQTRPDRPALEILAPYARQILAQNNQVVITGHFHQPFRQELENGELIALGDWIAQYSYLLYHNGRFELLRYSAS